VVRRFRHSTGAAVPAFFAPILADYIYISGGVIAAILLVLVVIWVLRRG
jgi:flagellar biogenesis protein FliO